jgi:hypothetical protein
MTAEGELEFQPGSRGRVLRNLLGITQVREMEVAETQALFVAQADARRCTVRVTASRQPTFVDCTECGWARSTRGLATTGP